MANVDDSVYWLLETLKYCGLSSKHGGGQGISLHNLRSVCEKDGKTYSGIESWITMYSNLVNIRKINFKKGAIALYLSCHHKDILTFMDSINEDKVQNNQ